MSSKILFLFLFFLVYTSSNAQSSFYAKINVGGSNNSNLTLSSHPNDRASICDEYINPSYASVAGCTDARGETGMYSIDFDSSLGLVASVALGLQLSSLISFEAEYSFASAFYNQTSPVNSDTATGDNNFKLNNEIAQAKERLGDLRSSNLYGNLVIRFNSKEDSNLRPYLGAGIGTNAIRAEYASVWARSTDPAQISTGDGQPNADEIKNNLAGTVSSANGLLKGNVISWKGFGGFEYKLIDRVFVTSRIQYISFGKFTSSRIPWNPLRSHVPNIRKNGSEPVDGHWSTEDLSSISLDFGIRYVFKNVKQLR